MVTAQLQLFSSYLADLAEKEFEIQTIRFLEEFSTMEPSQCKVIDQFTENVRVKFEKPFTADKISLSSNRTPLYHATQHIKHGSYNEVFFGEIPMWRLIKQYPFERLNIPIYDMVPLLVLILIRWYLDFKLCVCVSQAAVFQIISSFSPEGLLA